MLSRVSSYVCCAAVLAMLVWSFFTSPARAGTIDSLGVDSSVNLLVLENINASNSDVEGNVVVGGNATLNNYSINQYGTGTGLTVGGNLNFSSGNINGNALTGGDASIANAYIDGYTSTVGNLNFANGTINGNATTGGNATINSTYVDGYASTVGNLNFSSGTINGNALTGGNASISNSYVNGNTSTGGNLNFADGTIMGNTISGGNATIASTYIAGVTSTGGNLNLSNGTLNGNVITGKNATISSSSVNGNTSTGGVLKVTDATLAKVAAPSTPLTPTNPIAPTSPLLNVATESARLLNLSDSIESASQNGTYALIGGNTLSLTVSGPVSVFDISADELSKVTVMSIADPANFNDNDTLIFNILGSDVSFGAIDMSSLASDENNILFNMNQATELTLQSGIYGSLLAPLATVLDDDGKGGVIDGQVIVNNWDSSVQVNDPSYTGNLPVASTPEPGTMLLMCVGLLGTVFVRLRKMKHAY